jgi:hypothetical protein
MTRLDRMAMLNVLATKDWVCTDEEPYNLLLGKCLDPEHSACRVLLHFPLGHTADCALAAEARNALPDFIALLKLAGSFLAAVVESDTPDEQPWRGRVPFDDESAIREIVTRYNTEE